jgi:hypothetical protein
MLIKLHITMPSLLPDMDGNLVLKSKILRSGSKDMLVSDMFLEAVVG